MWMKRDGSAGAAGTSASPPVDLSRLHIPRPQADLSLSPEGETTA